MKNQHHYKQGPSLHRCDESVLITTYSKTCLERPLQNRPKLVFKTDYRLMQVKNLILLTFIKLQFIIKIFRCKELMQNPRICEELVPNSHTNMKNAYQILTAVNKEMPKEVFLQHHMGLNARIPIFGVCEQQKRRPACASAQSDQRLC